jgi:hypothetical protein
LHLPTTQTRNSLLHKIQNQRYQHLLPPPILKANTLILETIPSE